MEIVTNFDLRDKILSTLILTNQEINQENINNIKNQSLDLIIQYKLKKLSLVDTILKLTQCRLILT